MKVFSANANFTLAFKKITQNTYGSEVTNLYTVGMSEFTSYILHTSMYYSK